MTRVVTFVAVILVATGARAFEQARVIKVHGVYGIIDKGKNQGVKEGQVLYVRRSSADGFLDVCTVKVIRTTPNRAAVQQLENRNQPVLRKGDQLFARRQSQVRTSSALLASSAPAAPPSPGPEVSPTANPTVTASSSVAAPASQASVARPYSYRRASQVMMRPWLSLNLGLSVPSSSLIDSAPSFKIGGSYMVSTGYFNLGIELNNTFFSGMSNGFVGSNRISSASLLEALFVFRKFLNYNFFIEGGGGIYRPKLQAVSVDDIETSFSSAHFGLFGGLGIFLPTSRYAGIILKSRLHNYFDATSRQYFGLTGGFRFKVR